MASSSTITSPISPDADVTPLLFEMIEETLIEPSSDLTEDSDLFSEGLDSMGIMQLIIALEQQFDIQFESSDITKEQFGTIRKIADLISARKNS